MARGRDIISNSGGRDAIAISNARFAALFVLVLGILLITHVISITQIAAKEFIKCMNTTTYNSSQNPIITKIVDNIIANKDNIKTKLSTSYIKPVTLLNSPTSYVRTFDDVILTRDIVEISKNISDNIPLLEFIIKEIGGKENILESCKELYNKYARLPTLETGFGAVLIIISLVSLGYLFSTEKLPFFMTQLFIVMGFRITHPRH